MTRIVAVTLALAVLVQALRLVWVLVAPVAPFGDWRPQLPADASLVARSALFVSFDPFRRSAMTSGEGQAVTSLQLELFGITVNAATGGGSAIIAGPDGLQNSYAVGADIAPGVKLYAVAEDHVVLDRGGLRESLFIDQSVPAQTVAPEAGSDVTSGQPAALTADQLVAGVAFLPRREGAKVTGLVTTPLGDGAVFARAGLRPGDIVVEVNQRPINSAGDAVAITQQLVPGARLSLKVERGAAVVPIVLTTAE